MFSTRVHGLPGQGVTATAELWSAAAARQGKQALARRQRDGGADAPVVAWSRVDDRAISTRAPVTAPDAVIVEDASLLDDEAVLDGLGPEGYLLVNSPAGLGDLGWAGRIGHLCRDRLLVLPATRIADERLRRPLPGAALLGGLCAVSGVVSLGDLADALRERFGPQAGEANVAAAAAGHAFIAAEHEALAALLSWPAAFAPAGTLASSPATPPAATVAS